LDTVVHRARISGLAFGAPIGIVRLVITPSDLALASGDSLALAALHIDGRDSLDRVVTVTSPAFRLTPGASALLHGAYLVATVPGIDTLYVAYDAALLEDYGALSLDPTVARVRVVVTPP
jgi:hypothetical protein